VGERNVTRAEEDRGTRAGVALRPLVWLNVVCLDAPLVAISWQWLFARSFHVDVRTADRVALFLSAWLIYLGDRWFDSLAWSRGTARSLRERFYAEHRRNWIGWTLVVALADVVVVWRFVEPATLRPGVVLATIVLAYLAINAGFGRLWRTVPVKEVAVGILFAAGTLLVLLPSVPSLSLGFGPPAVAFACLCSLNCVSIAVWERDLDRARGRHSIATRWPRITPAVMAAAILLVAAGAAPLLFDRTLRPLSGCLVASLVLLAMLHHADEAAPDERTALADLALLTPGLLLLLAGVP
jgi:hypothetical protein